MQKRKVNIMKILTNKINLKIVSMILIFSIVLISIIPNYSMANAEADDVEAGGKLFRPVFQLGAGIGDLVMKTLQYYFYADFDIKDQDAGEFTFKYGPAAIFSGIVPGLDANFIEPNTEKIKKKTNTQYSTKMITTAIFQNGAAELCESVEYEHRVAVIIDLNTKTKKSVLEDFRNKYGYNNAKEKGSEIVDITAVDNTNNPDIIALSSQDIEKIEDAWMLEEGDKMVLYIVVKDTRTVTSSNLQQTVTSSLKIYKSYDSIDNLLANLEDVGSVSEGTSDYKYRFSIAGELKGTISKWYK